MRRRTVTLRPTRWPDPGLKPPSGTPTVSTRKPYSGTLTENVVQGRNMTERDHEIIEACGVAYWESIS